MRKRHHGWRIDEGERLGSRFGEETLALGGTDTEDVFGLEERTQERRYRDILDWLRLVMARVVQDRDGPRTYPIDHKEWLRRGRVLQDAVFDLLYGETDDEQGKREKEAGAQEG